MSDQVIAIDGPAGSGKSTVARALAAELGWSFLDTGAMYRALTLEALHQGINVHDVEAVGSLASRARITTLPTVTINGRDVSAHLRDDEVNQAVSVVAANALVREQMVRRQRDFAAAQPRGTVVEGRDITTVVFPEATLKVYLTASVEERSRRRGDESEASLIARDDADLSRTVSPLRQAHDALVVDTTQRSVSEAVEEIVKWLTKPTSF